MPNYNSKNQFSEFTFKKWKIVGIFWYILCFDLYISYKFGIESHFSNYTRWLAGCFATSLTDTRRQEWIAYNDLVSLRVVKMDRIEHVIRPSQLTSYTKFMWLICRTFVEFFPTRKNRSWPISKREYKSRTNFSLRLTIFPPCLFVPKFTLFRNSPKSRSFPNNRAENFLSLYFPWEGY